MFELFTQSLSLINYQGLTVFLHSGVLTMTLLILSALLMVAVSDVIVHNQEFGLEADEPEVLAMPGAESVSLQDYLDYNVNLYSRSKHGKFRHVRACAAQAVVLAGFSVWEQASYSAEPYVADLQDVDVEAVEAPYKWDHRLDLVAFPSNRLEQRIMSVFGVPRWRKLQTKAYDVQHVVTELVYMPEALRQARQEIKDLRHQIEGHSWEEAIRVRSDLHAIGELDDTTEEIITFTGV